jgi:hypothetical protein
LFLAYLLAVPILALGSVLAVAPLALYAAVVAAQSAQIAVGLPARRLSGAAMAVGLIGGVHVSYAIGFLHGLVGSAPKAIAFEATWADVATT